MQHCVACARVSEGEDGLHLSLVLRLTRTTDLPQAKSLLPDLARSRALYVAESPHKQWTRQALSRAHSPEHWLRLRSAFSSPPNKPLVRRARRRRLCKSGAILKSHIERYRP